MTVLFPEQQEDAYLQTLSVAERARFERLLKEEPTEARTDLICADCGAPLALRLGRYGRFYGCREFETKGCKGGVTAHDDGSPKGWPGNAETRAARRRLVERLAQGSLYFDKTDLPNTKYADHIRYRTVCEIIGCEPAAGFNIGRLDAEQCENVIEALDIFDQPRRTRWDHLRLESLLPGD